MRAAQGKCCYLWEIYLRAFQVGKPHEERTVLHAREECFCLASKEQNVGVKAWLRAEGRFIWCIAVTRQRVSSANAAVATGEVTWVIYALERGRL